jgi:hypothetical protein
MPLRGDLERVRDESVIALAAAHDHFVYTKKIWRIVDIEVRRRGRRIRLENKETRTTITELDLPRVAQTAANDYLPAATLQQFASLAETFLTDLVRLWVTAYPAHLKGDVPVQVIVAAPDKAAILVPIIDQYVLGMGYKSPRDWFKQLSSVVSLDHPSEAEIDHFAEFEATRDVFVHNRGIATAFCATTRARHLNLHCQSLRARARTGRRAAGSPRCVPPHRLAALLKDHHRCGNRCRRQGVSAREPGFTTNSAYCARCQDVPTGTGSRCPADAGYALRGKTGAEGLTKLESKSYPDQSCRGYEAGR